MIEPDEEVGKNRELEVYLRSFRPVVPKPLSVTLPLRDVRRSLALLAASLATVVLLVAALIHHPWIGQIRRYHDSVKTDSKRFHSEQPLTIGAANALLTSSNSFQAAIDQTSHFEGAIAIPRDKRSALAVLSEGEVVQQRKKP